MTMEVRKRVVKLIGLSFSIVDIDWRNGRRSHRFIPLWSDSNNSR